MSRTQTYFGNCLAEMKNIPDGCIDMICTDLPYGVLNKGSGGGKWDSIIPFEPMWEQFLRVTKEHSAIVLFAQGMFSARLMMSAPSLWRYNLVWDKGNPSGFLNANRMPLREHEDILVFYRKQPTFNPQMKPCSPDEVIHSRGKLGKPITNNCYGKRIEFESKVRCEKCPTSILHFKKPHQKGQHPTQKSVDLIRWLVRTYTNEGETVLDATAGSGTTGVACVIENRNFIGIENDPHWYKVMEERIAQAKATPRQIELFP